MKKVFLVLLSLITLFTSKADSSATLYHISTKYNNYLLDGSGEVVYWVPLDNGEIFLNGISEFPDMDSSSGGMILTSSSGRLKTYKDAYQGNVTYVSSMENGHGRVAVTYVSNGNKKIYTFSTNKNDVPGQSYAKSNYSSRELDANKSTIVVPIERSSNERKVRFYVCTSFGWNGSVTVFKDDYVDVYYTPNYIRVPSQDFEARLDGKNSDGSLRFKRAKGKIGYRQYVLSANEKVLRCYLYISMTEDIDKWANVTEYTNDYKTQQENYAKNAQYQTAGIDFSSMVNTSSMTSSSTSGNRQNRSRDSKANCPYCNGTGYYKTQSATSGSFIGHAPLHNSGGNVCRICGSTNEHWHLECKH